MFFTLISDEGRKLHFASPVRRKSVLAPILNKIKNGGEDSDKKTGEGHIALQIEPAKRVKVIKIVSLEMPITKLT